MRVDGYLGDGVGWTYCTDAVVTNYPADAQGTATGTNTSSVLNGSKVTQILGHVILTPGVGTVQYALHNGANLSGMAFDASVLHETINFGNPGDGVRLTRFTNANVGLKITPASGITAIFFWRKLL